MAKQLHLVITFFLLITLCRQTTQQERSVVGELLEDNELLDRDTDVAATATEEGDKLVHRVKRGRGDSRYNPETNPNRGRKRIRIDQQSKPSPSQDNLPQSQSFTSDSFQQQFQFQDPPLQQQPQREITRTPVRSRTTLTRNRNVQQNSRNSYNDQDSQVESQTQSTRSRSRSRSRSRTSARNFDSPSNNVNRDIVTERPRNVNRGIFNRNNNQQEPSDRDFNPQVLRNLNKFYTDQNEKRKGLFDRKKNYCDYEDYDRTDLLSSQDDPPSHITVTHTLPLATNINNFLLPSVTSVQLIAVGDLRSTNIDNSPVIFANTKTDFQHVLYDALRAKEEVELSYITSCYNGRQTVFNQQKTQTIYSVETVTQTLEVSAGKTSDINDLLSMFLSAAPQLQQNTPAFSLTSTEITQTITHSSTYVTEITETESTELSVTFRGKPIVTTILDTSVKEITATEFSTETKVNTELVTQTLASPNTPNTQLLQLSALAQQNPSLENQLLLLQLSSLLPQQQQQIATPALNLPQQELVTKTSEIIHTSTYVTTLTEESSDIIPLIFRGKQIETTLVSTQTREITATEYSTEIVTQTQAPEANLGLQLPIVQQFQQQPQADLLGNILPNLLNIPELALYPDLVGVQQNDDQYDTLENLISDLDPRFLAAFDENINFNKEPEPAVKQEIERVQPKAQVVVEPKFSVTTIFKSGRNPGEFTRLISTIYYDERKKREIIAPSSKTLKLHQTQVINDMSDIHNDMLDLEDVDFDLVQSGMNF